MWKRETDSIFWCQVLYDLLHIKHQSTSSLHIPYWSKSPYPTYPPTILHFIAPPKVVGIHVFPIRTFSYLLISIFQKYAFVNAILYIYLEAWGSGWGGGQYVGPLNNFRMVMAHDIYVQIYIIIEFVKLLGDQYVLV